MFMPFLHLYLNLILFYTDWPGLMMLKTNPALGNPQEQQYSLGKILFIWFLSAAPMGLLLLVVTPAIIPFISLNPLIVSWLAIISGLIWQFILGLLVLKYDGHPLSLKTVAQRTRFTKPVNPRNGLTSYRLFWWTVPFILLSALIQSGHSGLPDFDSFLKPVIKDLPQYDLSNLASPEFKGAWWILGLYLVTFVFNYFLGEEFMYRGILLPKMNGVFGKWDWLANGVLFGFYHLHKPQIILSTALIFGFIFAYPAKQFKSTWMAVIIHGLEGILGLVIILGVLLGFSNSN